MLATVFCDPTVSAGRATTSRRRFPICSRWPEAGVMTRPGLVVDSHRRPLSWVIVAASSWWYVGLLVAVGMAGLHLDVPLPWWVAQAAPPVALRAPRPRRGPSAIGDVAVRRRASAVGRPPARRHAHRARSRLARCAGGAGGEVVVSAGAVAQLLWVPVLLVPLRDLLRGGPVSRSAILSPRLVADRYRRHGRRRSLRRCRRAGSRSTSLWMPRSRSASRSSTSPARCRRGLLAPRRSRPW